jgi:DNA-binding transcriptional LysR family regulator
MRKLAWVDVELFLAVCRTTSLRGAAVAMGLDVSTVSRRLAGLEERFDARLFDRSRAGVQPTPIALALLETAEEMERVALSFERRIDSFDRAVTGTVRLTLTPSVGDLFLAELFAGFSAAHPNLELVVHVTDEIVDLERRRADVGLRFVRPRRGALASRRLATITHRVMGSAELVRRLGRVRSWAAVPWVLPETGPLRARVEKHLGRATLTTNSVVAQLGLVRAGLAVAVLPTFFLEHFGLQPLQPASPLEEPAWGTNDLWLVMHEAQRKVPRIAAVVQWLAERVPRLAAGDAVVLR